MGFGLLSLIARFVLGLGGSTNLSDTYAWGLWIVFDLVWIAIAAGAFATAGIIYVFQRKDLYTIGRSAVLMGFLSYSFVTVTLLADLGLPLHSYQLALQAPEASAMFEVSWCVGLYVTVLLLEFLPVPLQYHGFHKAVEVWRRWSGAYVVFAVTLFVYLLSRSFVYAGAAAILFSFRPTRSGNTAGRASRSCWRLRRSLCPPCTRVHSALFSCSCRTSWRRSGGRRSCWSHSCSPRSRRAQRS